jgi:hypothetical protein
LAGDPIAGLLYRFVSGGLAAHYADKDRCATLPELYLVSKLLRRDPRCAGWVVPQLMV